MASEWDVHPLRELVDSRRGISYGIVQPGAHIATGVPIVRVGDFDGGTIDTKAPLRVDPAVEAKFSRSRLRGGELLLSLVGSVGQTAIAPPALKDWNTARAVGVIPVKPEIGARWINAVLRSTLLRSRIHSRLNTTVQPTLNLRDVAELPIPLPPRAEREAIVSVIGSLEDRIERNRRMSAMLEVIAGELFENFLASGFVTEDMAISTVGAEFRLTMGQSPPGDTYNAVGYGLPFYQGRSDFGERFPRRRIYCTAPTRLAQAGDTLISVRAPVGDANIATEQCAIGRGVASARHRSGSRSYTYHFMRSLYSFFDRFNGEGTVFGSISKRDFEALPCPAPGDDAIAVFDRIAGPLDDRVGVLARETSTLAQLRDTLLPKLVSGDIRIRDAEKFLERAGA